MFVFLFVRLSIYLVTPLNISLFISPTLFQRSLSLYLTWFNVFQSVSLSTCPSVCISMSSRLAVSPLACFIARLSVRCLSVCRHVLISGWQFSYPSLCLTICLHINVLMADNSSVCLHVSLIYRIVWICLSIRLSVLLSGCLSILQSDFPFYIYSFRYTHCVFVCVCRTIYNLFFIFARVGTVFLLDMIWRNLWGVRFISNLY